MKEVYLDNCATTRPLPQVVESMTRTLTADYGNPSSLHNKGLVAERILKKAKRVIADRLQVRADEIIFTSGGTESNNLAIRGAAYQYLNRGKHLITTEIEHASVLQLFRALEEEGFEVTYLQPDSQGIISLTDLKNAIRPDTILVSMMQVNNELGSILPVEQAGEIIKEVNHKTIFHVDGIQAFGKIAARPQAWKIDLYSISGHKIHGPKGVGALYIKKGINLKPLFYGGGQEGNIRSGTENLPGIAGLIPAVESLPDFTSSRDRDQNLEGLKNYFLEKIKTIPDIKINTPQENSAPHIVNLSVPGLKGEVLVHSLEGSGVYVSTGSACHSKGDEKSTVLEAIKLSAELRDGSIRVSFSRFNTEEEIDYSVDKLQEQLKFLLRR